MIYISSKVAVDRGTHCIPSKNQQFVCPSASSDRKGFVGEVEAGECGHVIAFWLSPPPHPPSTPPPPPASFTPASHIVAVWFSRCSKKHIHCTGRFFPSLLVPGGGQPQFIN